MISVTDIIGAVAYGFAFGVGLFAAGTIGAIALDAYDNWRYGPKERDQ